MTRRSGHEQELADGAARSAPKLGKLRTELKEILGMLSASPGSRRAAATETTRTTRREAKAPELFD